MASKLGLMRKTEAVNDRLRDETNRLRARGVDVGTFPDGGRDPELREYERLVYTADLLAACASRIDELTGHATGDSDSSTTDDETTARESVARTFASRPARPRGSNRG